MTTTKLTKRGIDAFRHPGGNQRAIMWDTEVPGLGVRVYPKSDTKTFVVSYRHGGRKRLMKIGRYGVLTLDQARDEARDALALVKNRPVGGSAPRCARQDIRRTIGSLHRTRQDPQTIMGTGPAPARTHHPSVVAVTRGGSDLGIRYRSLARAHRQPCAIRTQSPA